MASPIPFSDLKPAEQGLVHEVLLHLNWSALILSLLTVATYAILQSEFPRSMPLWLGVSCTLLHSILLIGPMTNYTFTTGPADSPNHFLCYFQGAAIQFSCVAIYCWLFLIALYLYLVVVQKYNSHDIISHRWIIHVFAWGTPFILTVLPLVFLKFQDRGVWCWLPNEEAGAWEFGAYYAPLSLLILVTSFFWVAIVIRAFQVSNQFKTSYYVFQTTFGLFLFIASFAIQFFHRLFNLVNKETVYGLELIHTIFLSLIGFIAFLTFGLTYDNVTSYLDLFKEYFGGYHDEHAALNPDASVDFNSSQSAITTPSFSHKPFISKNISSPYRGYATSDTNTSFSSPYTIN